MRRSALLPLTAVLVALVAVGGCASSSGGGQQTPAGSSTATASPSSGAEATAVPSEEVATAASLTDFEAPSEQCAAMDEVLLAALEETEEGQAFTAAAAGAPDRPMLWGAFAQTLEADYGDRLRDAAGTDPTATSARQALTQYTEAFERLSSGEVVEFSDPQAAQEAIAEGAVPSPDPQYSATVDSMTTAHVTLTQCLPTWPVVF